MQVQGFFTHRYYLLYQALPELDSFYRPVIVFILSDCCQGGEEICKKTSKHTASSYIWSEDVMENKWIEL